jgi:outer membrane receptor protein involved in Fe transport
MFKLTALWRVARALLCPAFALLFVSTVCAQLGTGSVTGSVSDVSNQRVIVDAVVTATSPALQIEQVVLTDSTGRFRIPNLPPGVYSVQIEADGFRPLSRPGIALQSGVTLQLELQLLPETLSADEVVIVARSPTVDIGSTRTGLTIGEEITSRVPVAPPSGKGGAARSFEQLAELAPTARSDNYGASVAGTTSPENVYLIDGLNVRDPAYGLNATPLSIDFIKQTTILTGGYLPEYGRGGGGVLEVVTKSGTNEVHGSVFGYVSPWQAPARYLPPQDAVSTRARLAAVRDIGFDIGGPIIKDRLWFYGGGDYSIASYSLMRDLNVLSVDPATGQYIRDPSTGLIVSDRIPGTRRFDTAEQTSLQYLGKLTWSPSADDRVELSHRGTPTRSGGDGLWPVDYETGRPYQLQYGRYGAMSGITRSDSYGTTLRWTHSALDKRLTFDTTAGWQYQYSAELAADGSGLDGPGLASEPRFLYQRTSPIHSITDFERIANPALCDLPVAMGETPCPVARYYVGGAGLLRDRRFNTVQARELVTFLTQGLGHHIFKAGVDFEYSDYASIRRDSGGTGYAENASGAFVSNTSYGALQGPDDPYLIAQQRYKVSTISIGSFVQDSWSVFDVFTLNAGLRYDVQQMYADQGVGLSMPNQWSPRLGLIYDPTQSGRAKLFANYAKYYQTFPLDIMSRGGTGEATVNVRRSFEDCDPESPEYPASCSNANNLVHNPNNPAALPNDRWYAGVLGRTAIDPALKPQSSDEISGGAELEIIPNGRLGLTFIHREINRIIEDMSRDEGQTLFIGNPGEGNASDFPRAERTYNAGIVSFTKQFSDAWLAQASYTLSQLRGNWEGLFRSQTNQLDPGANSDYDLRSLVINRRGDLAGDRRHELKMFLSKDFPLGKHHNLNIGAGYQARSGAPTNYLGRHRLYGRGEVFLLPRGSGERLPWTHNIDLHVAYQFAQTKDQTFSVTVDIFNVFNFQEVIEINESYTYRAVEPITGDAAKQPFANGNKRQIEPERVLASDLDSNPRAFDDTDKNRAFGAPIRYQAPFTLRIGLRSTF